MKKVSNSATTELLNKIPNKKKTSNEQFNLCEAEISLNEITEPINSQKKKKKKNDGLTAENCNHFSKELAPTFLDI